MFMFFSTLLAQASGDSSDNAFGTGFLPPSDAFSEGGDTEEGIAFNIDSILSNLIGIFTVIAGIIFIIIFVIAALNWLTAGGDTAKVQKARDSIVQGVVGLIIIIAAYAIIGIIGSLFGLDLLNPGDVITGLAPGNN